MNSKRPDKIFKKIHKVRQKEFTPDVDPSQPFTRQYTRTKMGWFTMLFYKRRYDVIAIVVLVIAVGLVIVGILGYFALRWLWENVIHGVLF